MEQSQKLQYMCPHTAIYVSSCCYICVLMLFYAAEAASEALWSSLKEVLSDWHNLLDAVK